MKDEDDDPPIYKKGHSAPEVSYRYIFPAQSFQRDTSGSLITSAFLYDPFNGTLPVT